MSRETFEVRICDRCKRTDDNRSGQPDDWNDWGAVSAIARNPESERKISIGDTGQPGDLCPSCATGLFDWLSNVEKPAAPVPQKTVRKRAALSLGDRKEVATIISDAIAVQVWGAVEALKETPTSLLNDEADMQFVVAGVGELAVQTMQQIVDRFDLG